MNHKSLKMNELIQKLKQIQKQMNNRYLSAYAAQATFFILLSSVPIITLIIAISTYLPYSSSDVLQLIMLVVPNEFCKYINDFLVDIYSSSGKTVISVSVIALLWSASKGLLAITNGFNNMYGLDENSNYILVRIKAIIYTVIFIVFLSVIISGYVVVSHYYKIYIHGVFSNTSIWRNIFWFIRYAMGWLFFYAFVLVLFVVLPDGFHFPYKKEYWLNFKGRIKSQMTGAAFVAISWILISKLMILYMQYFPNISIMYGSLAGIVIILLWLYFCMQSLFLGAIINYMINYFLQNQA